MRDTRWWLMLDAAVVTRYVGTSTYISEQLKIARTLNLNPSLAIMKTSSKTKIKNKLAILNQELPPQSRQSVVSSFFIMFHILKIILKKLYDDYSAGT